MKIIKQTCYKGTHILLGNQKQEFLERCRFVLKKFGFVEIQLPIIQYEETFKGKVGAENNNLMYTFKDRGDRDLCLAPEYTAVIQQLAKTTFKDEKDLLLFYVQECFRGEKPQLGRFRQFTQLGIEIINPTEPEKQLENCEELAKMLIEQITTNYKLNQNVTRGLDYYQNGKGFEISCEELGSSKQVCGGGIYDGGVGFAIGVDRLLILKK